MKTPIDIQQAYRDYVLSHGQRPPSVRAFTDLLEMEERAFYEVFGSFPELEQQIFLSFFDQTLERLESSPEYEAYGTPEKLLALFFTWLEVLTGERSFLVFLQEQSSYEWTGPSYADATAEEFKLFVKGILKAGTANGEIADRLFFPGWYSDGLWIEAKGILRFWLADTSKNFEKTDAMVEKLIRFTYDFIRPNTLDSGWDFLKFMWQNR
jgi:hypothetical protein